MLAVCFKIFFLVLVGYALAQTIPQGEVVVQKNVQDHVAPTISQGEEIVQNSVQDYLPNPKAYVIGANHTTLVVCRARANDGGVSSLEVKCKGLRHRIPIENLTTVDDSIPSVTTSRLIVTRSSIKKHKHSIICHCVNTTTKDKSDGVVIVMKRTEPVIVASNDFKPKRNRKKKAKLHSSVKFAWRYENSSSVKCLHDGQLLTNSKERLVHKKGKISFHIKPVLQTDEGYYYCRSKSGVYSPWMKLQVLATTKHWLKFIPIYNKMVRWTKWRQLLPCSANCGTGKKVEQRKCLETEIFRCHGENIRVVPCEGSCKGIVPEFIEEPQDQVTNSSSAYITCAAQFGSHTFAVQLFCSSDNWKIHHFNETIDNTVNKTLKRNTFEVAINRDRNGSVVVECHCDATTKEMTKRSRIAKITFLSVIVKAHDITNESSGASFANKFIYIGAGIIIIILALLIYVSIVFNERRKSASRKQLILLDAPVTEPSSCSSIETERLTHVQPPDGTATKLQSSIPSDFEFTQNRTSVSSLLIDFHEQSEECLTKPLYDLDGLCKEDSVFQRDGSRKSTTSKFSSYSSVSATFCPKPQMPDTVDPDLCAWGKLTEKGGRLTIKETGVSLYVPFMALPKQTSQVIYLGLMNSKGKCPQLRDEEALLSPVVVCGPDGLQFQKPVYLTVPHNAVIDENKCWKQQVQSCSTMEKEEEESKWTVMEGPGSEAPFSHMSNKSMQIMIEHFTNYAVVGVPNKETTATPQLEKTVLAFFTEPKIDLDCAVRVYCIPATDAAFKVVEINEKKINGLTSDTPKVLRVQNNNKKLQVKTVQVKDGWSAVTGQAKSIPFHDIWQHSKQPPNVSFIFERVSPHAFNFLTVFDVKQEDSNDSVEVQVTFALKNKRRSSSGYSSEASGCEIDTKYQIPIKIRRELCHLLDRDDDLNGSNWLLFAERLGCEISFIRWLKDNSKIKSPTYELIEWWEKSKPEEIPLQHLVEILKGMERFDAMEVLGKIPGVLKPVEQPMV